MKVEKLISNKGLIFDEVKIINPFIYEDKRGFFYESWNYKNYKAIIKNENFCQENHSFSTKNVLRGLHYQIEPYAQEKFVECIVGEVYDVVVDLRKKSDTFLNWAGIELSDKNHKQIFIPEGFAHGFYTLSETAHLIYKVNRYQNKNSERVIKWNDPKLSIEWIKMKGQPILSEKDFNGKKIDELSLDELFQ